MAEAVRRCSTKKLRHSSTVAVIGGQDVFVQLPNDEGRMTKNDEARIPPASFMRAYASAIFAELFSICVHLRDLRPTSVCLSRELLQGILDNRSREVLAEGRG